MVKYEHSFPYVTGLVLRLTKRITNVEVIHRDRVEEVLVGWSSMMSVLMMIGGIILIVLGIIWGVYWKDLYLYPGTSVYH